MNGNALVFDHDRLVGIIRKRQSELKIDNDFLRRPETLDRRLFALGDIILAFSYLFKAMTRVLKIKFYLVDTAMKFTRSD